MTRDEIIKLAREAKLPKFMYDTEDCRAGLERFKALVAEREREACAKVIKYQLGRWVDDRAFYAATECIKAVQERNKT